MEQLLALEMSASPRPPRSRRPGSWAAATATRPTAPPSRRCAATMDEIDDRRHDRHRRGRARRGADALHRRARRRPRRATAATRPRSTSRSTRSRARTSSPHGQAGRDHRARGLGAGRAAPRPGHLPREAVRRAGRGRPGRHHGGRRPRTSTGSPRRSAARSTTSRSSSSTGRATTALIAEVRAAGARIKLISDGDLSAAICVRRLGHRRPRGHGDRRRARGRASPRPPCAASAARSRPASASATTTSASARERMGHGDDDRVYRTEDLASGENARLRRDRASRTATSSRGSASSAAAPGPTRS